MSHLVKVPTEDWRRGGGPPPSMPMLFGQLQLRAPCTDFKKFGLFEKQRGSFVGPCILFCDRTTAKRPGRFSERSKPDLNREIPPSHPNHVAGSPCARLSLAFPDHVREQISRGNSNAEALVLVVSFQKFLCRCHESNRKWRCSTAIVVFSYHDFKPCNC